MDVVNNRHCLYSYVCIIYNKSVYVIKLYNIYITYQKAFKDKRIYIDGGRSMYYIKLNKKKFI